jgi:hypothetical protein
MVMHNNIHDGNGAPDLGIAIGNGDRRLIEYDFLSKMGDYGLGNYFDMDYGPSVLSGTGCNPLPLTSDVTTSSMTSLSPETFLASLVTGGRRPLHRALVIMCG